MSLHAQKKFRSTILCRLNRSYTSACCRRTLKHTTFLAMASLIRKPISAALSPYVTGSLLYLLTRAPDRIRIGVLALLSSKLPESLPPVRLVKILRVLFTFGIASKVLGGINQRLSDWATNNWSWNADKARWHWNSEIAVVTGGCSGIGAEVVRSLLARGVKVAVLDIQALPSDLERSMNLS